MYRCPGGQLFSDFLTKFNLYLPRFKNVIITGDLNCNLLVDSFESNYIKNFICEYSLFSVPFGSTHHSGFSQLDVMIVDSSNKVKSFAKSLTPFAVGHHIISICYEFHNLNRTPQIITYRDFSNCDHDALANDLIAVFRIRLSNLLILSNIHPIELTNSLNIFYDCINETLNAHAPYITKRITHRSIPWLHSDLRTRIKIRDKLFSRAKRLRNPVLLQQYRIMRREIKYALKYAKDTYLIDTLPLQSSPNILWSYLGKLGLTNAPSQSSLNHLSASTLNRYYSQVASSHPPCTQEALNNILSQPLPTSHPSFVLTPTNNHEVLNSLNSIMNKSRGLSPDNLRLSHLKQLLHIITPYRTAIINLSFKLNMFPSVWKNPT
ncbi:hypothetical protein ALC57_16361 [Trachymyrmex cornetzi]|uniref:Endonuclease/exonuclease/phosphatase domain-containing protein n=1 Tax=Trachymyrmex cornetzi TaxID=471704 RepID=A0A151IVF7_9HYME|nr:hypothetical protein ALC57_16361 [Trachymyrmex cornetzi]